MIPTRTRWSVLAGLAVVLNAYVGPAAAHVGGSDGAEENRDAALRDYLSGNGLLNRGLYDLAASEYRKFLAEHADHAKAPVARYGLSVCLFRLQQHEAAMAELRHLHEIGGFQYACEVATMLGQCHLALKQYGPAAGAFREVSTKYATHALADEAAALATEALYLDGAYDAAISAGEQFVKGWPDSELRQRAEYFWALSEMARGNHAAAAKRFEEQLKRFPDGDLAGRAALLLAQCRHNAGALPAAVEAYRAVIKRADGQYLAEALHGLATVLYQLKQPKEAAEALDQYLERFPKGAQAGQVTLLRGRILFDRERYASAFRKFRQVAREENELADDAAYWMAKCKLRDGEFADAAERLRKAIAEFGDSDLLPEMMYDRAVALLRAEDQDSAIAALTEFRERFPTHALAVDALQLLATATHQQGHYDESLVHCRALIKQDPSYRGAASISFLIGENEFLSGRLEKAVAAFREYLADHPKDERIDLANYRIATALNRLGRYDEAASIYDRLSERAAEDEELRPALLALGDIRFQRGEWKEAEARLTAYLASGLEVASADEALLKLGLSKQRRERYEDALVDYDRLLAHFKSSPHRAQALFERGQSLVALHRFDDAATAFEQLLKEAGDSRFAAYAINHLGTLAMKTGNYEAAAGEFERVASDAPESDMGAEALFQRGQALMAAEEYQQAEGVFADFLKHHADHDRAPLAVAQSAIAIARQERHADAVEAVDRAVARHRSRLDGATRASLFYEKAWCLRHLDKPEQAVAAYREVMSAEPEGNLALHAMLETAELEANAKQQEKAIETLSKLVKRLAEASDKAPRDLREQAVYRLAVCRYETGQYDEAAKQFTTFIEAFPDSSLIASASFHCGEALLRLERHKAAIEHFRRVVEKYASDSAYGASLLRLGECLAEVQSWPQSEQAFATYLAKFGGKEFWFQAQFGVGWARENQARHDEAIQAYRKVVARHNGPTAARAQFQIGECLFAKKQYKDAATELMKVDILYAYPEWSAAALYEAGRCFEKLSQPVEARHRFAEVSEKYGQTHWASMAAERVAALSKGTVPGR